MRVFAKTSRGRGILAGLVLVLLCLCANSPLASAGKSGITISPALKEIVLGPGLLQTTVDVGVSNNTDQALNASIKLVDFKALDEFGGVTLAQAGAPISKYGLANWMSLAGGDTLNLAKGQSADLKVTIDNRADLTPGGHYGAVVVTASSANGKTGNKINFKQELVSLLFIKKLGGEQYGLKILALSKEGGSGIPKKASLKFASTGNVHVVPRGFINVTDPRGKLVAKGIINSESTLILPGTSRQFVTLLQPVADASLPGRYKMTAYYRYDGQPQFSTETVYFNNGGLKPVITTTAVALILIVVAAAVYAKRKIPKYKLGRKSRKH